MGHWSLLILFCGVAAHASPLSTKDGKVEFIAVGRPSALKINGRAPGPKGDVVITKLGDDSVLNGSAEIVLSDLQTGISMRDKHMKEKYFEVEKYPTAVLTLKDFKVSAAVLQKGGVVKGLGELALHGEKKPVNLEVKVTPEGSWLKAAAEFKLKISDFKIDVPKFSGIMVADEVTVRAETALSK